MANYVASNTAELLKYIAAAKAGDRILLNAGTYSGVLVQNALKSGTVTITSADPGHPAVLTDLTLKNCSNLALTNVEMATTKDVAFQVLSSSNIVLDRLDVHGTLNGSSSDDVRGMLVRDSSYVTVSNSHFHELTDALTHVNAQYSTFTGNTFDIIRDNGIAGGGSSHLTISNNSFTDFDHVGAIHPDAIQIWTANTTTVATDIAITGNTFTRGKGTAIQGIWISDDVGTLPFQNVTVTNNVIVGAMFNGIVVAGARDATMTGNVVIGATDQASWIGVRNVGSASMSDNIASMFSNVNSSLAGSGDVLTSALSLTDLASISAGYGKVAGAVSAGKVASGKLVTSLLGDVGLIGYVDGPSTNGLSHMFTVVQLDGTPGSDRLAAGAVGSYRLRGLDGNDTLNGGHSGQAILMEGGRGDDTYNVYQACDVVNERPGEGNDTIFSAIDYTLTDNVETLRALASGLTLHGNALGNTLAATAGGDILFGEGGDDTVQGAAGNDVLYGNDGNDRLFGYDGDDSLDGGAGNDVLYGGNGNDRMFGGDGTDTLEGGAGLDTMTGGKGADTFVFRPRDFAPATLAASKDIITDFNASEGDKIGLSAIDANVKTASDDAFTFIGSQAFHGIAGELRYVTEGDGITVYGDTNGDKVPDLGIHLTGLTAITSSSFML